MTKGYNVIDIKSPRQPAQKTFPKKKEARMHTEISLETLEILLTSIPEENSSFQGNDISAECEKETQIKNIKHFLTHKQHYQKRIEHLVTRKRGAEWLTKNLAYFHSHFPWELISLLENMAYEESSELTNQHEYRDSFINQPTHLELIDKDKTPNGLRVITSNIRRLIYENLERPLQQLRPELLDMCSSDDLNEWNIWCRDIEHHIKTIEDLLYDGQCFFSLNNFKLMEQLPISKKSKMVLSKIINKVTS